MWGRKLAHAEHEEDTCQRAGLSLQKRTASPRKVSSSAIASQQERGDHAPKDRLMPDAHLCPLVPPLNLGLKDTRP